MNNVANTRILRLRSGPLVLPAGYILPGMLVLNTVALVALDRLGGIPAWVKTAVSLFLAF